MTQPQAGQGPASPALVDWAIIALGNPGADRDSRQNIGVLILDTIAGEPLAVRQGASQVAFRQVGQVPVVLGRPLVYPKRCGPAVKDLLREYRLSPERLIFLVEDLDLPFGQLRVRGRGGHQGHVAMRSLYAALDTHVIRRIRIGVDIDSHPPLRAPLQDSELSRVPLIADAVRLAIKWMIQGQDEKAMSLLNRRDIPVDQLPIVIKSTR